MGRGAYFVMKHSSTLLCRNMHFQSNFMFCGYSIVAKQPPPYACERVLVVVVVCKAVHYNAMSSLPTTCNLQTWRAVTMPTAYNVSAAAAIVGASPSTIRNWIKTFD